MFILRASMNKLDVVRRELMTSGSVQVYPVKFTFDQEWDGLTRTACFKAGATAVSVLLDDTNECVIPWEITAQAGVAVQAGVYGLGEEGAVVLPTVWGKLGMVELGAEPGDNAQDPTASVYEQWIAAVKAYYEGAAESATAAAESASKASESTSSAAESAETALAAQEAAETAKTASETAQTAAEKAEANAESYAASAQKSAASAATLVSSASGYASKAASAASAAAESASEAKERAEAAETAQKATETAQETAESAATTATEQAEIATQAAEKATQSAADAAKSETDAAASAEAAEAAKNSMVYVTFTVYENGHVMLLNSELLGATSFSLTESGHMEVTL